MTSIVAALALVAVGGAAALGRGSHPVALALTDGGGWLASERLGLLFHVNGPSGQADAAVALPGAAGHPLTVLTDFARPAAAHPTEAASTETLQPAADASATSSARPAGASPSTTAADLDAGWPSDQAEAVIVVDAVAGTAWLVDPSLLTVSATVTLPPGAVVLAAAGEVYAVDAAGGRVIRLDPNTLAQLGAPITFPAGLGTAAQTPDGTLWVPVPSAGTVVPVRAGVPGAPVAVAPAGDRVDVTTAAGSAVVVDQTAGTVARLAVDRADAALRLPVTAGTTAGTTATADRFLVSTSADGHVLALAEPASGQLLLANLTSGQVSATTLPAVGASDVDVSALAAATGTAGGGGTERQVGAPVSHGGQVYVPDSGAGVVWDFDPTTARFAAPVSVAPIGTQSRISLDVQNGQLWINDETGPTVVLVNGASRRTLLKFGAALPGGARSTSPKPLPPGPTPASSQPSPASTGPGTSRRPGLIWPGWTAPGQATNRGDTANRGDGGRGNGQPGSGNGRGGQTGGHNGGTGQPTRNQPTQNPPPGSRQPEPPPGTTVGTPQPEPTSGEQPTGTGGPAGGHNGGTGQQGTGDGGVGGVGGQGAGGQGVGGQGVGGLGSGGSGAATDSGGDVQSPGQAGGGAGASGGPPAANPTTAPAPTGPPGGSVGAPGHTAPPATPTPTPGHAPTPPDQGSPRPPGFWLLTADGSVLARGTAEAVAAGGADPGAVALAPTASGRGYWLVDAAGAGRAVGDAPALATVNAGGTVVAAAAGPTGGGYWTVTAAGAVVPHGTLPDYGSLRTAAAAPVVGIAATPTGGGYWLLDAAGGVYPFGDAAAIAPGAQPTGPASGSGRLVGIAASPTGAGYWTVTAAGAVSPHGAAGAYGSATGTAGVVGIAATPSGRGYWLLEATGEAHAYGDAVAGGAPAAAGTRVIAVAAAP